MPTTLGYIMSHAMRPAITQRVAQLGDPYLDEAAELFGRQAGDWERAKLAPLQDWLAERGSPSAELVHAIDDYFPSTTAINGVTMPPVDVQWPGRHPYKTLLPDQEIFPGMPIGDAIDLADARFAALFTERPIPSGPFVHAKGIMPVFKGGKWTEMEHESLPPLHDWNIWNMPRESRDEFIERGIQQNAEFYGHGYLENPQYTERGRRFLGGQYDDMTTPWLHVPQEYMISQQGPIA